MSVKALKDKHDDLVLAALDIALLIRPYDPAYELPKSVCDSDGNLITGLIEEGWLPTGEVQKKAGVDLTPDAKFKDIEGYGSKAPRRRLKESESITLDFTAQEARKLNKSLFYDVSLSAWQDIPGGNAFTKYSEAEALYWSVLAIANDRYNGLDIFPFWLFGRMSADKSGKLSLGDNQEIGEPISLVGLEHPTAGLFTHGIAGRGWLELSKHAGFDGAAGAPWTVAVTGSPTGGTFVVKVGSAATSPLPFDATAAAVQTALTAITGPGKVSVSGSAGGPWSVALDATVNKPVTVDSTGLTGGTSPKVTATQAAS